MSVSVSRSAQSSLRFLILFVCLFCLTVSHVRLSMSVFCLSFRPSFGRHFVLHFLCPVLAIRLVLLLSLFLSLLFSYNQMKLPSFPRRIRRTKIRQIRKKFNQVINLHFRFEEVTQLTHLCLIHIVSHFPSSNTGKWRLASYLVVCRT